MNEQIGNQHRDDQRNQGDKSADFDVIAEDDIDSLQNNEFGKEQDRERQKNPKHAEKGALSSPKKCGNSVLQSKNDIQEGLEHDRG